MDSLSSTATLLVLTSREDEEEGLIRTLRNGGLAVRGIFIRDPEMLEELAASDPFELILCCEYDPAIDLDSCMSQYQDLDLDIPLIVIADEATDSAVLISALRAGARDMTKKGDTDHLQLAVARELSGLEHRRNEQRLREQLEECQKRSQDIIDAADDAIAFIQEGIHVQINPAYQELYGFDTADALDGFPLLDVIAAEFHERVGDTLRTVEQRGAIVPAELDVQCVHPDGERFDAHLILSRSMLDGRPCVRVITEVPEVQTPSATQYVPQSLDGDTGLPNRAALVKELETRIGRTGQQGEHFAVIYVGISVFRQLRKDRGLTGALRAAVRFGQAVRDLAPEGAYLARVADDGFILLLADVRQPDAVQLIATIKQNVRLPIELESQEEDAPQCGAGLMFVDSVEHSVEDLLDGAYRDYQLGMLNPQASASSAETSRSAEPDQKKGKPEDESKFAELINEALKDDALELVYQPIVSLKGDSRESYTVLVRLRDEDEKLRDAKDFLGIAIKSGKMVAVDRWVIRNAIAKLALERSQGQKINFFVTVAEETLQEEKLLIWICDYLREFQARGNWLTVQVLEEHACRHAAVFTRLAEGLRKVRCRLSLTRFGNSANPEALLQSLNLDFVKFPPEMGNGLADDEAKQERLLELTQLCREAEVKSIVTGVEDARSLTLLWTTGIDYVEGNFLQKPTTEIGQAR